MYLEDQIKRVSRQRSCSVVDLMKNESESVYYIIPSKNYVIILMYLLLHFGVVCQVCLLIAFIKDPLKCFRNSGTYLVANLAVSDLLMCLCSLCVTMYKSKFWIFKFLMWTSADASIFTLASISLDRFLMVVYPLKHRVVMGGKVVVIFLTCLWIGASIYPAKWFFFVEHRVDHTVINCVEGGLIVCEAVFYGLTYRKLKQQSSNFASENLSDRQQQVRVLKEKQFLRTIILVASIALTCILPTSIFYYFAVLQDSPTNHGPAERIMMDIFPLMFLANFCVNPLVYLLRLPNYRKTFYLLYCCKGKRSRTNGQ